MPPVALITGPPHQLALHSHVESMLMRLTGFAVPCFATGLMAHRASCARAGNHYEYASIVVIPKDASIALRYITLTALLCPSCSLSVAFCVSLLLHCSASGSIWQVGCRPAKVTRPVASAAGLLRLATCTVWLLSLTQSRPGPRARADLRFAAKWRAQGQLQVSRADSRAGCPCVRRAGKVRAYPTRWFERPGGAAGGAAAAEVRARTGPCM